MVGTTWLAQVSLGLGIVVTALCVGLFSSLQHEIIHGHPFENKNVNEALVFPALPLLIPYLRFRDTHLDHHFDANLTDPYDDPESNYLDPDVWQGMSTLRQKILLINNTLAGRILIGVLISQVSFMISDWRAMRKGDGRVLRGWLWHVPALVPVLLWLGYIAQMPLWAALLATYMGLSVVKIRTFLEHQAHDRASGRTAIVEDRGPLAMLFLNNNLHVVHHIHPRVAWYDLPRLYANNRAHYQTRNGGYVFASYGEIFRKFLWQRKDPVPHPIWRRP
jgi:fatty acid desaturase